MDFERTSVQKLAMSFIGLFLFCFMNALTALDPYVCEMYVSVLMKCLMISYTATAHTVQIVLQ